MSELTTNKLNELLAKQADQELNTRLENMFREASLISSRMQATQDIGVNGFTIKKGTYIENVLNAVKKSLFAELHETNRYEYIYAWLNKLNFDLAESKHLKGGK